MTAPVNRRALLGGCTAGALLFGAAGPGKAAELDGELLTLVAQLVDVKARIDRNCADSTAAHDAGDRETCEGLDAGLDELQAGEFWPLVERIIPLPARTPEGVAAKARAVRIVWLELEPDPREQHCWNGKMVFSLLDDLAAECAA